MSPVLRGATGRSATRTGPDGFGGSGGRGAGAYVPSPGGTPTASPIAVLSGGARSGLKDRASRSGRIAVGAVVGIGVGVSVAVFCGGRGTERTTTSGGGGAGAASM